MDGAGKGGFVVEVALAKRSEDSKFPGSNGAQPTGLREPTGVFGTDEVSDSGSA